MSAAVATVAATFYVSAARSACLAEAGVAQNRRKQRRRTSPTNPRLAKNFCSAVTLPPLFRKPPAPQTHPARSASAIHTPPKTAVILRSAFRDEESHPCSRIGITTTNSPVVTTKLRPRNGLAEANWMRFSAALRMTAGGYAPNMILPIPNYQLRCIETSLPAAENRNCK
jgi:hypothetical protein